MWMPKTKVSYEDRDNPRTDGEGRIFLPYPPQDADRVERALYFYKAWHEKEHNRSGKHDWVQWRKSQNIETGSLWSWVLNIGEDMMNDFINHDEYRGVQECIEIGRKAHWEKSPRVSSQQPKGIKDDTERACHVLWQFMNVSMGDWCTSMEVSEDYVFNNETDPTSKKWLRKILDKGYGELIREERSAEKRDAILRRIWEEEFELEIPPDAEKGPDGASSGEGAGEGEGDDDGEGADSTKGDGEGEEENKRSCHAVVKFKDLQFHEHSDKLENSGYGLTIDYTGHVDDTSRWHGYPIKEIDQKYSKETSYDRGNIKKLYEESGAGLSKKVKRLLQRLSQTQWNYDQKKGVFDNARLYRVATYADGTDRFSKIFKKGENRLSTKDTALMLLIDCSGSMNGGKFTAAAVAAVRLAEASIPLGVSLSVAGFTQDTEHVIHYWFKKWGAKFDTISLLENLAKEKRMSQNADGDSILHAYENLKRRKETHKILIVLSDGQPAAFKKEGSGDITAWTKKVVKHVEESKVSIYGIGIMDRSVEYFYRNRTVINKADQLEERLLDVMKAQLLKDY
jgi:Mg-chelatase subunit ChlD